MRVPASLWRYARGFGGNWRQGGRGIFWTMDYPHSDRHFNLAIRRLTRLHSRSVEEPVNLDDGFQYDWPWLRNRDPIRAASVSEPVHARDCPAPPPRSSIED